MYDYHYHIIIAVAKNDAMATSNEHFVCHIVIQMWSLLPNELIDFHERVYDS